MGRQSCFSWCRSGNFTVILNNTALFFSESQLALKRKFLVLIDLSKCTFIHLLARQYLIPFRKTFRAKGNNCTDRHLLNSFSRYWHHCRCICIRLAILQRQRRTRRRVKHLWLSLFGKLDDGFLAAKNSTVLLH